MRSVMRKFSLLVPVLMLLAAPLFAEEGAIDKALEQREGKDECLLVASNCRDLKPIEQKIERIKKEIGRGTDVYTNEELNNLKQKLDDEMKSLNDFYTNS